MESIQNHSTYIYICNSVTLWLNLAPLYIAVNYFVLIFEQRPHWQKHAIWHFIYSDEEFASNTLDSWMENSYQWNGSQLNFESV